MSINNIFIINITQLMNCIQGPAVDSRMKPPDVGPPVLQTHAPITPNFPSGSSREIVGDYVEK